MQATATTTKRPARALLQSALKRRIAITKLGKSKVSPQQYQAVKVWAEQLINEQASEERCLKLIQTYRVELAVMIPGRYADNIAKIEEFIKSVLTNK
jgi:hypothetical protein